MHDLRSDFDQEGVRLLDVLAGAGAEADVVQSDAPLLEPLAAMLGRRGLDPEPGPPADAVVDAGRVGDAGQPQERQQLRKNPRAAAKSPAQTKI